MQLTGRLEIKSQEKISEFLNTEHVGRICSIDQNGYPQIIPMNFVFYQNSIYMHSFTRGEKLDNIKQNNKVGFEVDRELEFLPSYFTNPYDPSQADTLYISVVIKGVASIVNDNSEKTNALNALMEKYQPEGGYVPLDSSMHVLDEVAVIKIIPHTIKGKYKIGQHLSDSSRVYLATQILKHNSPTSKETLRIMGFEITQNGLRMVDSPSW